MDFFIEKNSQRCKKNVAGRKEEEAGSEDLITDSVNSGTDKLFG
jgi:hypothetical protein